MTTTSITRRPFRTPILEPTDFLGDFDRLMSGFLRSNPGNADNAWWPRVDLRETDEAFLVEAELPGMTKKDVELTLEDGVLTLSGERRREGEAETKGYRHVERRFGAFSRSFSLPRDVSGDKVKASFDNGLLTITVPKKEAAKPRAIEIS